MTDLRAAIALTLVPYSESSAPPTHGDVLDHGRAGKWIVTSTAAAERAAAPTEQRHVTGREDAIRQAVDRFLSWELPSTFGPDCGISFDGRKPDQWNPVRQWPVGTNLFTADEARAMFEHCIVAATPASEPQHADGEVLDICPGCCLIGDCECAKPRASEPQAEPQPTANAHAFSPSESDRHLLFAHTPTRYAGDYPWYLNLTMLRMRGDVVLTVRLPTSHGKPPGETGSVRLTREMWRTLVAAIGDADVVFKATDELDAML